MFTGLWQNFRILLEKRALINYLVRSSQHSSYFRNLLGRLWLLLGPMAHLCIYYFVVVVVFKAHMRMGVNPFVFIMAGLAHYQIIQATVNSGKGAIISKRNILLQIKVEPLLFVAVAFRSALAQAAILLIIYVVFFFWLGPPLTSRALLYPFILMALVTMAWSFSLMAASLVVFFRDLQQAITIILRLLLYLCPIIYPLGFVPQVFQEIYLYNPLACLFAWLQWSLLGGAQPSTGPTLTLIAVLPCLLLAAHSIYNHLHLRFTKVL
jgi:lipopolysaccharide transport system permease protein